MDRKSELLALLACALAFGIACGDDSAGGNGGEGTGTGSGTSGDSGTDGGGDDGSDDGGTQTGGTGGGTATATGGTGATGTGATGTAATGTGATTGATTGGTGATGTGTTATGTTTGTGTACLDVDNDGVTDCAGDCDDNDDTSYPGAPEICGDGVDNDCIPPADQAAACPGGIGTYVSALVGDDLNLGTKASPVRTIAKGIANAQTIGGGHDVYVAETTTAPDVYDEKVVLVEGISLLGGHQCDANSCTWTRDPSTYVSEIVNVDRQGVHADVTITSATELDGFTITGLDVSGNGTWQNPGTSALTVSGGTPIVRDNEIVAGDETGGSTGNSCGSWGVRILGPTNDPAQGVRLEDNRILAGDSQNYGCPAVGLTRTPAPVAKLDGNWIKGGTCDWNRAVNAWSSGVGTVFHDNDIFAGDSATGTSFAMVVSGYNVIDGNRINHDPAEVGTCGDAGLTFWCGGIECEGATTTITNNVVYGMTATRSVAIFMGDGETPFGVVVMNANTLDAGGAPAAGGIVTNISTALACRTSQGTNAKIGRVRNNILLGGTGSNRFGLYEMDQNNNRTCEPTFYENNDIHFPAQPGATDNAHRQWLGSGNPNLLPTVADVNNLGYAQANFALDPLLTSTWHLMTGSSCIDAGTAADAPAVDFEGDLRPQGLGIDVGADETPP